MATLKQCRNELSSIINELVSIEDGVRYSFKGIGQNKCADCLESVINKYRHVLNQLDNVDTNALADFINGGKG